uniref:Proteasome subunit alpha type n=1 Tax=Globodera pallida TaxID=36090 RepID=A0A183C3P2_GLOPA
MGSSERYSFSLTTFSPSGKLMQIEYALNAVKNSSPSVGIRARDCVVLATENKQSPLTIPLVKIGKLSDHLGCAYSGMGPDAQLLMKKARKIAADYETLYGHEIHVLQLVSRVAAVMQEYTQSGGVRPFGASLLIGGWDAEKGPLLFQADPAGSYFAWKSTAIGKNDTNAKGFLEKRYNESIEKADAIHMALLTLRETYDIGMTEDNVELVVCTKDGYERVSKEALREHIRSL